MLRSLFLSFVYLTFLVLGATAPFVFTLGYVWVDSFNPQSVAYSILSELPISLIVAIPAVAGHFLFDRRAAPPVTPVLVMTLLLAVWITMSTAIWAVVPVSAWVKWGYAFKTIMFSAFIPFAIRSRVQMEAFLQIYLFALAGQFLPVGIKTLLSGGGYGMNLGLVAGNSGLSEGSTLSAVSLMTIPIALYLREHSVIVKRSAVTDGIYVGLIFAAVLGAIGTYERTALVGMAVLAVGMWLRARRKALLTVGLGLAFVAIATFTTVGWSSRIATTADYRQESSALGRILVWEWTLGYVLEHPQGGGFNAYEINKVEYAGTPDDPTPMVFSGKAFHSIYFEMLGEQGWVGLMLFLGLIGATFGSLRAVARRTRRIAELRWCADMASALQIALAIMLTCGAFIGVAFQPMIYYLFALSSCLRLHVLRVETRRHADDHLGLGQRKISRTWVPGGLPKPTRAM